MTLRAPIPLMCAALLSCGGGSDPTPTLTPTTGGATPTPAAGSEAITAEVWADNWFAMYVDEALVGEDSVPITTERSFNAETFTFSAVRPFLLATILKDYKEDDTGLEYIGEPNQQMGDGGVIAQLKRTGSEALVAVSSADWVCLVIHKAPLNKECEDDPSPSETCQSEISDEPDGWMTLDFDDSAWAAATEYTEADVSPKDGYDEISWDASAKLIWTSDLETDNTLLCRLRVD